MREPIQFTVLQESEVARIGTVSGEAGVAALLSQDQLHRLLELANAVQNRLNSLGVVTPDALRNLLGVVGIIGLNVAAVRRAQLTDLDVREVEAELRKLIAELRDPDGGGPAAA